MLEISGKVWLFQKNIDTDLIVPGRYLDAPMEEIVKHVFESIRPEFACEVSKGDIIVADENFGCGSSRESAPAALKELGVGCVVAESIGRIFFRNAIAIGLPVLTCKNVAKFFPDGHSAVVQIDAAVVRNTSKAATLLADPLSKDMITILEKGGVLECLGEENEAGHE